MYPTYLIRTTGHESVFVLHINVGFSLFGKKDFILKIQLRQWYDSGIISQNSSPALPICGINCLESIMPVRAWTSNALGNGIAPRAEIADPQMQVAYLLTRFYSSLLILQAWLKKRKQTNAGLLFSTSWPISATRAKEESLNISQKCVEVTVSSIRAT